MKVTVLGHSYVRDLAGYSNSILRISDSLIFEIQYIYVPGARFQTFIDRPHLIQQAAQYNPDIVIVLLGGNDISENVPLTNIREICSKFYSLLNSYLTNKFVISVQVEPRYLTRVNRHGTPAAQEYQRLSGYFNFWLKKQKFKNRLVCVCGPNRLSDPKLYKPDGIHLNQLGISRLFTILKFALVDTANRIRHD